MKVFISQVSLVLLLFSCTKISDPPLPVSFLDSDGVYLINEGNFTWGNGSLSFYSYDSSRIYNDIFRKVNERALGDVPNSMNIFGEIAYIIVNNSGKIEVVNKNTMESVKTIPGLISPRNIGFINTRSAYVTSMYSDSVVIISLVDYSITGYINIRRKSESVIIVGQKAFISEWIGGNELMVINTLTNKVIDSVKVGIEPESMIVDRNNVLWVLCNGGWTRSNYAELVSLNTQTYAIQKKFIFPSKLDSPTCLQINGRGDTLFYIEKGVRSLSIDAQNLPTSPLISETDHLFNKIGINPVNSDIFISDAVDYKQRGFLLHYDHDGKYLSKYQTDIIPGQMYFKLPGN
jgi:YVTN family beta-propeller protein